MLGPTAKSDTVCRLQSRDSTQPPISNRRGLRSAGCQSAFLHHNLLAESHEPEFLIDTLTIRNRRNSNKIKDAPNF
jgi:hypothetical protein